MIFDMNCEVRHSFIVADVLLFAFQERTKFIKIVMDLK